eukprot:COSAG02_NODE_957_length_15660_cov_23.265793_17_plen_70_part_01
MASTADPPRLLSKLASFSTRIISPCSPHSTVRPAVTQTSRSRYAGGKVRFFAPVNSMATSTSNDGVEWYV